MASVKPLLLSLLPAISLFLLCSTVSSAQTITVCADGCDYTTIQAAAAAAAPHAVIAVAPGIYPEHLALYDKQVTINGAGADATILDGGNDGRVLFLYANTALTLTNVTVRNGRIPDNQGGGIYSDGLLSLDASRVISNSASVSGGGIANFGTMIISNSVITGNNTTFGNGGGIVNGGGYITITNSTLADNHAQTRGGGIYHSSGILTLVNSTVANNHGDFGGGGIANFDRMQSINSTISGNVTDGAGGGLINGGRVIITNLTVADNHAGDGNSLYNSGTLTATNTIMADNLSASEVGKNCTNWGIVNSLGGNLESGTFCGFSANNDLARTDPLLAPLADNGGKTPTHALLPGSPAIDAATGCPPPITDQRGVARPHGVHCDIGAVESGVTVQNAFTWPAWARTARIAGAYFAPDDSDATIDAQLDELAAQQVSVVLADSPWGEQWAAWVDDATFTQVRDLVARVVQKAHARGLKVVMYQVGLERISPPTRNPGLEHPEWAQLGLNGQPILFDDVSNAEEHWLDTGTWDFWLSPCDVANPPNGGQSFRQLAFARVADMTATGIDGLWVDQVYLQSSVGSHDDLWPSSDECSAAAFHAATGYTQPTNENWDEPAFQHWIVWRHEQIAEFLAAEKAVARAINPDLVFFNENSSVDAGRATYVANDPTAYLAIPEMSTGHEVETIADRMDEGETGMQAATLDQWLAFRTMIAFARGADRGKPSWILTYGYQPRDSAQLAGMVLAEGANFYETKGPQMADTVGGAFRTQLFGWIADQADAFYSGDNVAEVGLLYSPRTRDLVDTVSGEPYDVQDAVHFAAYRRAANLLYRAHIPFDVVIDTDTAAFARYSVLIAPEVQAMSDATLSALNTYTGSLLTTGETGDYTEWMIFRATGGLTNPHLRHFNDVTAQLVAQADSGLLQTDAAPTVQLGLRHMNGGYAIVVVNTTTSPTEQAEVAVRLQPDETVQAVTLSAPGVATTTVSYTVTAADAQLHLTIPAGIDPVALLRITVDNSVATPTPEPTATVTTTAVYRDLLPFVTR